jgi:hypothetical protein
LHETDQPLLSFHVEHIIAKKHRGSDDPDNLAWACLECNLGKSSNLSGRDPGTGRVVRLFNPRRQRWGRFRMGRGSSGRPDTVRSRHGRCLEHQCAPSG